MKSLLLSIVIPCLNEKSTIARVISDADKYAKKHLPSQYEIIVADNGSTDGTLTLLKKFARQIRLVPVPVRGYGAALHWGITNSRGKYVLFADADGSYPFSNLVRFVKSIDSDADLILGSRLKGVIQDGAMPLLNRYLGTPVLTILIRWLYHIPTTDCNSGMRLVKRSFYQKLNMRNSGMEWASELLLKTAIQKGKYEEVTISFQKDKRHRPPHLSRWADGWRHLKTILLLKPKLLPILTAFFLIISMLVFPVSYAFTSLFIMFSVVLFFSWLALLFLAYAINGVHNEISLILNSNLLVPWVTIFTTISIASILLLPDSRLGSKMTIIAILSVVFIWTFLIETIKTHLVNRLPELKTK